MKFFLCGLVFGTISAKTDVTSTLGALANVSGSQPQTQNIINPERMAPDQDEADKLSDSSDDDYFSVADTDDDSDDDDDLREETDADWEARQKERQRVLEAAGLIVNEDVKPPPRLERARSARKRRPPPAAPRRSSVISSSVEKNLPPVPELAIDTTARLDDAFDRYEAFKQEQGNTNRLSMASFETAYSSPGGSPALSQAPSATRESESRPYSQLFNFLGRRTPANDGSDKRTLTISGPIMSQPEYPSRENSPAFGSVSPLPPSFGILLMYRVSSCSRGLAWLIKQFYKNCRRENVAVKR